MSQATADRPDPSIGSIEFIVPTGTVFSLPREEVFTESPEHLSRNDRVLKVVATTPPNNREFYISERSLLKRSFGNRDIKKPAPQDKHATKDRKEIEALRSQVDLLKKRNEAEEQKTQAAEDLLKALKREKKSLEAAYSSKVSFADWLDESYETEYRLRVKLEHDTAAEINTMRSHLGRLRSDIEEVTITESKVAADYSDLLKSITDCTLSLKYRLPQERKQELETLRPALEFDTNNTRVLSLLDYCLPTILFKLIHEELQRYFAAGLTDWFDFDQPQEPNSRYGVDRALLQISKVFYNTVPREELPASAGEATMSQKDIEFFMRTFHRWRSDTVSLLTALKGVGPFPDENSVEEKITRKVSTKFLARIRVKQDNPETPFSWGETFESRDVSRAEAEDAATKYEKKIHACVRRAVHLRNRLRSGRAYFGFEWAKTPTFKPLWMETQQLTEAQADSIKADQLYVMYCRYPAIFKYGTDDGSDFSKETLIKAADVYVHSSKTFGAAAGSENGDSQIASDDAQPPRKGGRLSLPSISNFLRRQQST
ncbi:MAG: hypothetical protein M1839_003085 [Geoglossum umbratile]|nr:MAG: hypothetical protein M1839_003085 [Geoglossum umbratile]